MNEKSFLRNLYSKFGSFLKSLPKKNGFKTFISVLMSIVFGLLIGLLVLLISNPRTAFPAFGGILAGPFGHPTSVMTGIGDLLYNATPLILTGLSVGFAFKTGLFNIGASGQFMVGQFATLMVAFYGQALGPFQWIFAILAGVLAGAIWGFIPGFFKAFLNVNEVITSIMFNYIGMYLTNMFIRGDSRVFDSQRHETFNLNQNAFLPKLGIDKIFPGSRADIGILIAILIAIFIYIVLNKTKFGFEIKGVGFNRNASRYAGINEKKSIILSMTIAGALAGLGGAMKMIAPGARYIGNTLSADEILAPEGFNGIPVALLGLSNPIGIIFSALFITHIQRGGFYVQTIVMYEIIDIIIAIIIYFSAFTLAFRLYIARKLKKKNDEKLRNENNLLENTPVQSGDKEVNNG